MRQVSESAHVLLPYSLRVVADTGYLDEDDDEISVVVIAADEKEGEDGKEEDDNCDVDNDDGFVEETLGLLIKEQVITETFCWEVDQEGGVPLSHICEPS